MTYEEYEKSGNALEFSYGGRRQIIVLNNDNPLVSFYIIPDVNVPKPDFSPLMAVCLEPIKKDVRLEFDPIDPFKTYMIEKTDELQR